MLFMPDWVQLLLQPMAQLAIDRRLLARKLGLEGGDLV
jgi:hypothetical protein